MSVRLKDKGYWYIASSLYMQFLVGSFLYLVSSFLMLLLWKREQYGLGLLPHLNTNESVATVAIRHVRGNYANELNGRIGRVDRTQMFFLVFYVMLATASTMDLVFAAELLLNKNTVSIHT